VVGLTGLGQLPEQFRRVGTRAQGRCGRCSHGNETDRKFTGRAGEGGAISPDGRMLLYSDKIGVHSEDTTSGRFIP